LSAPAGEATPRFDVQAAGFDRRAGLPLSACEAVADALVDMTAPGPDQLVLELGAGTGVIGLPLSERVGRYVGLDISQPMLDIFQEKLGREGAQARHASLVQADANQRWPVPESSVSVVFASRAAHLFDEAHLVSELRRTSVPAGAWLVLGRVRREAGSWREALRGALQERLGALGYVPRSAGGTRRRLMAALERSGGSGAVTRSVAQWSVQERPSVALGAWRGKSGLAGVALPAAVQEEVLQWLEAWARERYGDLDAIHEASERYELTAFRLAAGAQPAGA
jgi:ubiquinone/menaquinone biosynthesis C-methylase UbiE